MTTNLYTNLLKNGVNTGYNKRRICFRRCPAENIISCSPRSQYSKNQINRSVLQYKWLFSKNKKTDYDY